MSYKLLIVFVLSLSVSSCFTFGKLTRSKFKMCYTGLYSGLDTLIDIGGYYQMDVTYSDDASWNMSRVLFFDDGMFLVDPQIENIAKFELDVNSVGKYWNWGIYKLSNDTIIGQYLYVDGATSSCESVFYKIIDNCNIQRIHPQRGANEIIDEVYDFRPLYFYKFSYSKASFVPFKELPNPDNSLAKSKKWFWCDKLEYKEWKKSKR